MDAKLGKLTKRVHATEQGISNTEEKEAETKRSMNRERLLIFYVEQSKEITKQKPLYSCLNKRYRAGHYDAYCSKLVQLVFEYNRKVPI